MTDIELQKDIVRDLRGFLKKDGIMMPLGMNLRTSKYIRRTFR